MSAYTPEIYRRFATPLQLDLGPTATSVEHTRIVVDEIKQDTDAVDSVSKRVDDVLTKVNAVADQATALDLQLTTSRQALEAEIQEAQVKVDGATKTLQTAMSTTADDIVRRVIAGVPHVVPKVNDKAAPLVRLLIQAQAIALDETPNERYPKNNKNFSGWLKDDGAIVALGVAAANADGELAPAPDALQVRFRQAFEKFASNSLPYRAKRFADMHAMIGEVAAFLNKP